MQQLYIKTINSITHILPLNKIVLDMNGKQIFNPTEDMVFLDGWKRYDYPNMELSDSELIELERNRVIDDILVYDSSDNVNIFYVNQIPMWLDKNTRFGLMFRLQSEYAIGLVETSLWYNFIEYKMPVEDAMQMLCQIEIYASKCYDNTQLHISNIKRLNEIEDIKKYNYKDGYPDVLQFSF